MRISDQQIYGLANRRIMNARSESVIAGDQVSSGKRVTHPWDDAGDAGMISRHAQEGTRQSAVSTVATRASDELNAVDSALDQVTTSLTRAHELSVQLANDSYSATDRANGALEIQQLMSAVVSQLNLRFGDRYVFGGMRDASPPFDATGNYLGDTNVRQVEIAPSVMQDASLRADQVIKGVGGGIDVLTELATLSTALQANNTTQIRASVQSLADGIKQISNARSKAGAMMNVFDVAATTANTFANGAQDAQAKLEDVDIFAASTRLAAAQRGLEASMSAAAQQFRLSLLDKL